MSGSVGLRLGVSAVSDGSLIDSRRPCTGHRVVAAGVAVALVTLAAIVLPFSHGQLREHPGFMPAFGTMVLLVDALTAGLLLVQAQQTRDRSGLRLAAAYLFTSLIIVPHLLAFPGVLAVQSVIGGPSSAIWLWCIWHGGFPLGVIWFVLGRPGQLPRLALVRTVAVVCLVTAGLGALATADLSWMPQIIVAGQYNRLNTLGIGPAILIATVVAEILVLVRLRCRNPIAVWLSVALLAAILDVSLTLAGGGRFTLGWYAARGLSLMTSLTVFFALISELMREAGRVAGMNSQLERMLRTDVLTRLANRRAFNTGLETEWRRANREQTALSLLMIDIDWFKGFNDRYGHPAGDVCLQQVAAALADQVQRPADLATRLGGEEFAVLLPSTEEIGAHQVAERIRAAVAALELPHASSALGHLTVSIGVATIRPFESGLEACQLVSWADEALYAAKAAGRNSSVAHAGPQPDPWIGLADSAAERSTAVA